MFLIMVSNSDIDFFKMLILKLSSKEAPWGSSREAAYFMPQRVHWLAAWWALTGGGGGFGLQMLAAGGQGHRAPRASRGQQGEVRGGRCGSAFALWPGTLCCPSLCCVHLLCAGAGMGLGLYGLGSGAGRQPVPSVAKP